MLRHLFVAALLLAGSALVGVVASFLLTPVLWRLEAPLGLELAGHSGPAEWVILTFILVACTLSFGAWRLAVMRKRSKRQ